MRYKLNSKITIRSENAAKPAEQQSQYLRALISGLPHVSRSLDYGCGKLRYADVILRVTETLTVVDSDVQISREQRLGRQTTSIRELFRQSNRINARSLVEFGQHRELFDRAFCINVLSVVPIPIVRKRIIRLLSCKLRARGTCLFVVQYRNSDFTRMKKMKNARKYCDGFLINSLRGFSFYGLIRPEKLTALVSQNGFRVLDCSLNEGSAYVLAETKNESKAARIFRIDEARNFEVSEV